MDTFRVSIRRRHAGIALTVALPLGIFFLAGSTALQYRAALAFLVANAAFFALGSLLTPWILRGGRELSLPLFTRIWLGQSFGLPFLFLLTLFNKGVHFAWKVSFPMPVVAYGLLALVLGIFLLSGGDRVGRVWAAFRIPPAFLVYLAVASAALAPVLAVFAGHLAAFGLDMHQHVYWSIHIFDMGFIPFNERFSAFLSSYPKTFHLLSAAWAAFGIDGDMLPVFVKMMPCYQAFLFCMVLLELVSLKFAKRLAGASLVLLLSLAGLFLVFYMFFLIRMPYPVWDLLGTPRFSSVALCLTPFLLFYLGYFLENPKILAWSAASFPLACAFALTLNPALLVLECTLVLPLLGVHWLFFAPKVRLSWRSVAKPLFSCCAFALLFLSMDAWVIGRLDFLEKFWFSTTGYSSLGKAMRTGRIPARKPTDPPKIARSVCMTPRCWGGYAMDSIVDSFQGLSSQLPKWIREESHKAQSWWSAPSEVPDLFSNFLPYRVVHFLPQAPPLLFLFPALGLFWICWKNSKKHPVLVRKALFVYFLIWGSIYLGGFLTNWAQAFLGRLHTLQGVGLLVPYLSLVGGYWGAGTLWILLVLPFSYGLYQHMKANGVTGFELAERRVKAWLSIAVVLALMAFLSYWGSRIRRDMRHSGWMNPVSLEELAAVKELNRLSLKGNLVIPAYYSKIGGEDWLLPEGEIASIMPFVKHPVIFHIRLNRGMRYSWQDFLDRFCSPDAGIRDDFIRRAQLRYLLIRSKVETAQQAYDEASLCQRYSLQDFGILPEAVFDREGIRLFPFVRR